MRSWNYFLFLGILLLQDIFLSSTLASAQPLRVLDEFSKLGGTGFENEHNLLLDEEAHILYGVNEWDNIFFKINLLAEQPKMEILYHFSRENKIVLPQSKLIFSKDKKYIYGIADETVYRINLNPEHVSVTLLHKFDPRDSDNGHHPTYSVVLTPDEKYLYGITNSEALFETRAGTIFRIDLTKYDFPFTTLHKFDDKLDGSRPVQIVINREGTFLYGTTSYGGENDCGTIFQYNLINTIDKPFTLLDNFKTCGIGPYSHYKSIDLILSHDNKFLYGAHGGIFKNGMQSYLYRLPLYNTASLEIIYLFDKRGKDIFGPASSLALNENDSMLYGTSSWSSLGGANSCGTLFAQDLTKLKKNPAENKLINLYAFECYVEGSAPQGLLLNHDSKKLYGTTIWGGKNNHGIIFEFSNIS